MGPGHIHAGGAASLSGFQHIHPQLLAHLVGLAGNLFAGPQHGVVGVVAGTHGDDHVALRVDAQHRTGEQFLRLGGIALISHAPLGLPDALDDHLLGGLGGDAAELGNIHADGQGVAHLHIRLHVPGGVQLDLQCGILHFLHHGLDLPHGQALLGQVHHHVLCGNVLVVLPVLLISVGEGLLQPLHHIVHGDALELFQVPETFKNFCPDVYLGGFRRLFGSCISCHDDSFLLSEFHPQAHQRHLGLFKGNGFFSGFHGDFPVLVAP